jgi:uncharacterized protein YqeY
VPRSVKNAQELRDELRADLRTALKKRDPLRVSSLRNLIAAIDNAEAVALPEDGPRTRAVSFHIAVTGHGPSEVPRKSLSQTDIAAIVQAEVDALQAAAAEYRLRGATAPAQACEAKAAIVLRYHPLAD